VLVWGSAVIFPALAAPGTLSLVLSISNDVSPPPTLSPIDVIVIVGDEEYFKFVGGEEFSYFELALPTEESANRIYEP
jgi:hypothetical protein